MAMIQIFHWESREQIEIALRRGAIALEEMGGVKWCVPRMTVEGVGGIVGRNAPYKSGDRSLFLGSLLRNVMLTFRGEQAVKPMLSVVLDAESEQYLVEILSQEKTTSGKLIKLLLRDRWRSLQAQQTVLERMGGYPEYLLDGPENLSDRDARRAMISHHLQQRQEQRQL